MKAFAAFIILLNSVCCASTMSQAQREAIYRDMTPISNTESDNGGSCHLNTECSKGFVCMKHPYVYSGVCINTQNVSEKLADK